MGELERMRMTGRRSKTKSTRKGGDQGGMRRARRQIGSAGSALLAQLGTMIVDDHLA
jgi:hypothetical protein